MLICYASTNQGKLRETKRICDQLQLGWQFCSRPSNISVPDETGRSFLSNAYLKAAHIYAAQKRHCARSFNKEVNSDVTIDGILSEDSGLCIDALDGAPGIYSARFGGIPSGQSQCMYLLDLLKKSDIKRPRAFYISATIFIVKSPHCPSGVDVYCGVGTTHGYILPELRGEGGFGYDPVFYSHDLGCSMAEAHPKNKSMVSHRYRGLVALRNNINAGRCL